jgi:hypothetical protein
MPKVFPPKQLGRCLQCQTDLHEIREVWPDGHPLAGEPRRLGAQLDIGTQVRFLMSNGSTADIAFCVPCAEALEPADFWPLWRACVARQDVSLRLAGRSLPVRRAEAAMLLDLFPLAIVARRRASPDGLPMLDRRSAAEVVTSG